MAIKALVTSEEYVGMPAEMQAFYQPSPTSDELYRLDVESVDGWGLDDTMGLKKVLAEVKDERTKLRSQLKDQRESLEGHDVADLLTRASKADEMQNWSPEDKVREQIALEVSKIKEKYDRDMGESKTRSDYLLGQLNTAMIKSEAASAIRAHGGSAELLLPIVEGRTKLEETDEGFQARVYGPDGVPLPTNKAGSHDPMGISEFVGEVLRTDERYAPAFSGAAATGSGAVSNNGRPVASKNPAVFSAQDMKDPAVYQAAREAAEKSGRPLQMIGETPWDGKSLQ